MVTALAILALQIGTPSATAVGPDHPVRVVIMDRLPTQAVAIAHFEPSSTATGLILLPAHANARHLEAGVGAYVRLMRTHPDGGHSVVKSTRGLDRVLAADKDRKARADRILVDLRRSVRRNLPGLGNGRVLEVTIDRGRIKRADIQGRGGL
jgi:hypothetical protein